MRKPPTPPPKGVVPEQLKGKTDQGKPIQPDGRHCIQGISLEKYRELTLAFFEEPITNAIAKQCNVAYRTAKTYVEDGNPGRGWPPIRDLYKKHVAKIFKRDGREWEKSQKEWREIIALAKDVIKEHYKRVIDDPEKLREYLERITPKDAVYMIDKTIQNDRIAHGVADTTVDVNVEIRRLIDEFGVSEQEARLAYHDEGK